MLSEPRYFANNRLGNLPFQHPKQMDQLQAFNATQAAQVAIPSTPPHFGGPEAPASNANVGLTPGTNASSSNDQDPLALWGPQPPQEQL